MGIICHPVIRFLFILFFLPLCYILLSFLLHILLSFTYSFPFCVRVCVFVSIPGHMNVQASFLPHIYAGFFFFFFVTDLPLLKQIYPLSINVIFHDRNSLPHRTKTWGGSNILSWTGTSAQVRGNVTDHSEQLSYGLSSRERNFY